MAGNGQYCFRVGGQGGQGATTGPINIRFTLKAPGIKLDLTKEMPTGTTGASAAGAFKKVVEALGLKVIYVEGSNCFFVEGVDVIDGNQSDDQLRVTFGAGTGVKNPPVTPPPKVRIERGTERRDGIIRIVAAGSALPNVDPKISIGMVPFLATDSDAAIMVRCQQWLTTRGWDVSLDAEGWLVITETPEGLFPSTINVSTTCPGGTTDDHWSLRIGS